MRDEELPKPWASVLPVASGAEILLLLMAVVAGGTFQPWIVGVVGVPRPTRGLTRQLLVGAVAGQASAERDIVRFGVSVTAGAGETRGNVLFCQQRGLSGLWLRKGKVRAEKPNRENHRLGQRSSHSH